MKNKIKEAIQSSINVKQKLLADSHSIETIKDTVNVCVSAFKRGNSVYFCGNGGSAADAQHLSAELSGRFYRDRDPLPSEALHVNTSYLTAVANDYGYEHVYSRLIKGIGKSGDILIGLSTSGRSKNVINAFNEASKMGICTIGMTGDSDNAFSTACDIIINVPSKDTPRIQEATLLIGHTICQLIEEELFDGK